MKYSIKSFESNDFILQKWHIDSHQIKWKTNAYWFSNGRFKNLFTILKTVQAVDGS